MARLMSKWLPASFIAFALSALPAFSAKTAAEVIQGGLLATGDEVGFTSDPLPVITGRAIQALLGIVGLLFLVLTVYAGVLYMTANGETGKIEKAKGILKNSIIGLVIVVGAYTLTTFVVDQLIEVTKQDEGFKKVDD